VNGEKCVALSVFAAQQGGGFNAAQLFFQPAELLLDVFGDLLAFTSQFEKSLQVFDRALQLAIQFQIVFKLFAALKNRLRLALITPKARIDDLRFNLAQFLGLGFRVKDNSGYLGLGFSATEIPGSILQA
jgi:uncharacterized membrane protein YhfC